MKQANAHLQRILAILPMVVLALLITCTPGAALADSNPARATLEVMVEGRLVKTSRIFACESYTRTDLGCFLCRGWRGTLGHIAEPLPSGGVLLATFEPYCDGKTGAVTSRKQPRNIAWADKSTRPTRVELYRSVPPALSDQLAKSPRIIVESIKFSLDPYEGPEPPSDHEWERRTLWYDPIGGASRQARVHPYPRQLLGFSLLIVPSGAWRKLPWLVERVAAETGTGPIQFTYEERKQINALLCVGKANDITALASGDCSYAIPASPIGSDAWELNYGNIGIISTYYLGRSIGKNVDSSQLYKSFFSDDHLLDEKWYEKQALWFSGRLVMASDMAIYFDKSADIFFSIIGRVVLSEIDEK